MYYGLDGVQTSYDGKGTPTVATSAKRAQGRMQKAMKHDGSTAATFTSEPWIIILILPLPCEEFKVIYYAERPTRLLSISISFLGCWGKTEKRKMTRGWVESEVYSCRNCEREVWIQYRRHRGLVRFRSQSCRQIVQRVMGTA